MATQGGHIGGLDGQLGTMPESCLSKNDLEKINDTAAESHSFQHCGPNTSSTRFYLMFFPLPSWPEVSHLYYFDLTGPTMATTVTWSPNGDRGDRGCIFTSFCVVHLC